MRDEVGSALGQASLTVEEQASTFSTFANNGEYISPHVILEIQQQQPGQAMATTTAKVTRRQVLTPQEDSDVDYALSFDTKPGGTAPNAGLPDGRAIIAKTGTTNLSQSAFFIGSIPQFTLAVGMFTDQQGCPANVAGCQAAANQESAPPAGVQTLYGLAGLQGYGGQMPASIWHIFAMKEFAQLPAQSFPAADFGGTAWNLLGPYTPKPKPTASPTPAPSATCLGFFFGRHCHANGGGGQQSPSPNPTLPIPTAPVTPFPPTPSLPGGAGRARTAVG